MSESPFTDCGTPSRTGTWNTSSASSIAPSIFALAREELRRSGFEEIIAAGIVLTGGSAKMEGAIELAEEVFHVPVRLGQPQHIKGLSDVVRNPIYSTGAGLLLYARDNAFAGNRGKSIAGNARSMAERMKNWFQGNF